LVTQLLINDPSVYTQHQYSRFIHSLNPQNGALPLHSRGERLVRVTGHPPPLLARKTRVTALPSKWEREGRVFPDHSAQTFYRQTLWCFHQQYSKRTTTQTNSNNNEYGVLLNHPQYTINKNSSHSKNTFTFKGDANILINIIVIIIIIVILISIFIIIILLQHTTTLRQSRYQIAAVRFLTIS